MQLKIKYMKDSTRKARVYKTWHVQLFIYYRLHSNTLSRFIVFVQRWYTDGAFLRGAFFRGLMRLLLSWSCRKRVLLKHPSDVAVVRGRRPFTSLATEEEFTLAQRAMRRIFDVKVLLPRLVYSASKFQTSCLWNLTLASLLLRQQLARVTYARAPAARWDAFIGKFNERKSLLEMLDIYWRRINEQLVAINIM